MLWQLWHQMFYIHYPVKGDSPLSRGKKKERRFDTIDANCLFEIGTEKVFPTTTREQVVIAFLAKTSQFPNRPNLIRRKKFTYHLSKIYRPKMNYAQQEHNKSICVVTRGWKVRFGIIIFATVFRFFFLFLIDCLFADPAWKLQHVPGGEATVAVAVRRVKSPLHPLLGPHPHRMHEGRAVWMRLGTLVAPPVDGGQPQNDRTLPVNCKRSLWGWTRDAAVVYFVSFTRSAATTQICVVGLLRHIRFGRWVFFFLNSVNWSWFLLLFYLFYVRFDCAFLFAPKASDLIFFIIQYYISIQKIQQFWHPWHPSYQFIYVYV